MYIKAVADSVTLSSEHNFYNIIFKIKQIIYSFRGSPPPLPTWRLLGAHLIARIIRNTCCILVLNMVVCIVYNRL
jgi:hypothetical protein